MVRDGSSFLNPKLHGEGIFFFIKFTCLTAKGIHVFLASSESNFIKN